MVPEQIDSSRHPALLFPSAPCTLHSALDYCVHVFQPPDMPPDIDNIQLI